MSLKGTSKMGGILRIAWKGQQLSWVPGSWNVAVIGAACMACTWYHA